MVQPGPLLCHRVVQLYQSSLGPATSSLVAVLPRRGAAVSCYHGADCPLLGSQDHLNFMKRTDTSKPCLKLAVESGSAALFHPSLKKLEFPLTLPPQFPSTFTVNYPVKLREICGFFGSDFGRSELALVFRWA